MVDFFDKHGKVCCYLNEKSYFYSFTGKPLGYLNNNDVHSIQDGHWLGWMENGWLYDCSGSPCLYSKGASGGPSTPLPQLPPLKSLAQLPPLKPLPALPKLHPLKKLGRSTLGCDGYWNQ